MKRTDDDIFSKLPNKLVNKLMPFQREGVKFAIKKNGRCLIADEMGLGKTLQAISVAYYYKSEWPLLIIVPSSLRYSWIEEFEKWLPDINPGEINLIQSGTDSSGIENSLVTITTFGLLSNAKSTLVKEALVKQAFKVVIVDESHYIKNVKTVTAKTVVPLIKNADRRILLSGTPALARPVELYPQIDAVCPNMFGNWWSYTSRYCDAKLEWFGKMKRRNVNGASNLEELQQKLSSLLMIRREKSEVLTQLPPKQRQRILFELKDSNLKQDIRKTFDELRSKLKQKTPEESYEVLTGGGDHDQKDFSILQLIQQLYQLSGDAKIGPAKEYIEMLCENSKLKFLIFAYHHNMMNGVTQSLYDKQIKFIRIDGTTPPSDRPVLVNQFQSDPDTRVAVLSILAAGVGLTLTAASLVVFAEMYWTPGVMVQCEDRAHRIGQTSHVAIHYLVAKDTMDEWVWSAVCKKTIVTSATLVGKKRKMEALEGDQYQIDVLSKAEAWVPTNDENLDLTGYFNTQLNPDQKSIKDFFSPSHQKSNTRFDQSLLVRNDKRKTADTHVNDHTISSDDDDDDDDAISHPNKKQKLDTENTALHTNDDDDMVVSTKRKEGGCVVVIDSDSEDDFAVTKSKLATSTSKSTGKKSLQKSRKKSSKNSKCSPSTPKCNLVTMFSKKSNKSPNEMVDYRDGMSLNSPATSSLNIKLNRNKLETGKTSQWNCTSCTFLNHNELAYCEMCETPKKTKPALQPKRKHIRSMEDYDTHSESYSASCLNSNSEISTEHSVESETITSDIDDSDYTCNEIDYRLDTDDEDMAKSYFSPGKSANISESSIEKSQDVIQDKKISEQTNEESENTDEAKIPLTRNESDEVCVEMDNYTSSCKTPLVKHSSMIKKYRFKSIKRGDKEKSVDTISCIEDENSSFDCVSDNLIDEKNSCMNMELNLQEVEKDINPCKDEGLKAVQNSRELLADVPVYSMFKYRCSKYTGRVYLITQDDVPLNINFIPIDVEVCNYDALPEVLHHPNNLKLVQRFVREWQNLTETKRRLIIKAGRTFLSPLREYEDLQSCKTLNTQRNKTKADTAHAAHTKAAEVSGSVRVISKSSSKHGKTANKGITQALDKDGIPLCVQCFKPYRNSLLDHSTIVSEENAWQTRFCSEKCAHNYWLVTNNEYIRDKMYEIEHGVCQICQLDAHALFRQIRDTHDQKKRAELLTKSQFNTLTTNTKQQIVKKPVAGQFWHVDHIIPVWEGGGQCDMDNLRTLCVLCHQKVTAKQAGKRAIAKKLETAVKSHDITAFFKKT